MNAELKKTLAAAKAEHETTRREADVAQAGFHAELVKTRRDGCGAEDEQRYLDVLFSNVGTRAFEDRWERFIAGRGGYAALPEALHRAKVRCHALRDEARAKGAALIELRRAARIARAEEAAYRAQHGARPAERPNSNAAANYDVLAGGLREARAAFIETYVPKYVAEAHAQFKRTRADYEARLAKNPTSVLLIRALERTFSHAAAEAAGRRAAEAEFDGYLAKLAVKIEAKIARVESLKGNLWEGSFLGVDTDAGHQVWSTGVRQNARYGHNAANGSLTLYLQWPTRRVS